MTTVDIFNSPILTSTSFMFILFLVLFAMEEEAAPHKMLFSVIKGVVVEKGLALSLMAMFSVLALNYFELQVEKYIVIPNILTSYLNQKEIHFLTAIQALQNYPLTFFLTYIYVFGFPALVVATLTFYYYKGERILLKNVFFTYILNYLIALPFYLFLPVTEAWAANDRVLLLIQQVYPAYNAGFRVLSGIDNNFPSLHTSISMSMALIALKYHHKRFTSVSVGIAAAIVFSTMYLGIHWILDVVAGVALAVFTVYLGSVLSAKPAAFFVGYGKKAVAVIKSKLPLSAKSAKDNFPF